MAVIDSFPVLAAKAYQAQLGLDILFKSKGPKLMV